ncbi:MAG: hypothetical protein R3D01_03190 [Hyphomicrobiales bacterium]
MPIGLSSMPSALGLTTFCRTARAPRLALAGLPEGASSISATSVAEWAMRAVLDPRGMSSNMSFYILMMHGGPQPQVLI